MWYIYLIINKCEMFYTTFNHIIFSYTASFSYIIFYLLLCAKMYYVIFNQLIYIIIFIISHIQVFFYIIPTHVLTFHVNFLPANLLVLIVIIIVCFTCRLTSWLELMLYVLLFATWNKIYLILSYTVGQCFSFKILPTSGPRRNRIQIGSTSHGNRPT